MPPHSFWGDAELLGHVPRVPPTHLPAMPPCALRQVVLMFPHSFWGDVDMFGHVQPEPERRGAYYLFYGYEGVSGGRARTWV